MASIIGWSSGQFSCPRRYSGPQILEPILDLPEPEGPTTRPICQSSASIGRSASRSKPMPSTLKRLRTQAAR
jgi:hypothetical protein